MNSKLEKEFQFYLEQQDALVEQYNGKYIVIKHGEVIGAFDDEFEAIDETSKAHKKGSFLVQFVSPGDSAYTQNFYSRVAFP